MLKTSILQEIADLGLDKSRFSILQISKIDCINLIKEFGEFSVFYMDEKGGKTFVKEFKQVSEAKNYLIDLYKILNGELPFFNRINSKEAFEKRKNVILSTINDNLNSTDRKDELVDLKNIILKAEFKNWIRYKEEITAFLITNGFSFERKIFDQVFLFCESVSVFE